MVPSTEMVDEEESVWGVGWDVQVVGLGLVNVRCPETSRGKDQKSVGHNSGS